MLDRLKLAQELQKVEKTLFHHNSAEIILTQQVWQQIAYDPTIAARVAQIDAPLSLPSWQGNLGTIFPISQETLGYHILSVDGSQIYPDRHQGPSCYLINIGSILFQYGNKSHVHVSSQPSIFSAHTDNNEQVSTDTVNCHRQELEFNEGLTLGADIKKNIHDKPFLLLFDGSLIFWLLEAKDTSLQNKFLHKYITTLNQIHQKQIPIAGYISLPKSRELVNIIRLALANFDIKQIHNHTLNHIFDSTIAECFLKSGERTIIFQNNASISQEYPYHLRPHFFYINVGTEIARVEIPQWIAIDSNLVDQIAHIIIDQCKKGYGYPIAIAEAHEAAVVKGPDRDFFYHLLDRKNIQNQHETIVSQKSRRKKYIGF